MLKSYKRQYYINVISLTEIKIISLREASGYLFKKYHSFTIEFGNICPISYLVFYNTMYIMF